MANDDLLQLHKQHSAGQDKYTYFLLAVTASAVAFSVQKTAGRSLSWPMLPLGLAILSWGISFHLGCKNLVWIQTAVAANYKLLQLHQGVHPAQPVDPRHLVAAASGTRSAVMSNTEKARRCGLWQFRFLVGGGILFLIWHILEMALLTNGK